MENSFHFFPLWKRGMKGDLTAFQKAKRLRPKKLFEWVERRHSRAGGNPEIYLNTSWIPAFAGMTAT
jgi:hypothetical protein